MPRPKKEVDKEPVIVGDKVGVEEMTEGWYRLTKMNPYTEDGWYIHLTPGTYRYRGLDIKYNFDGVIFEPEELQNKSIESALKIKRLEAEIERLKNE